MFEGNPCLDLLPTHRLPKSDILGQLLVQLLKRIMDHLAHSNVTHMQEFMSTYFKTYFTSLDKLINWWLWRQEDIQLCLCWLSKAPTFGWFEEAPMTPALSHWRPLSAHERIRGHQTVFVLVVKGPYVWVVRRGANDTSTLTLETPLMLMERWPAGQIG